MGDHGNYRVYKDDIQKASEQLNDLVQKQEANVKLKEEIKNRRKEGLNAEIEIKQLYADLTKAQEDLKAKTCHQNSELREVENQDDMYVRESTMMMEKNELIQSLQ